MNLAAAADMDLARLIGTWDVFELYDLASTAELEWGLIGTWDVFEFVGREVKELEPDV